MTDTNFALAAVRFDDGDKVGALFETVVRALQAQSHDVVGYLQRETPDGRDCCSIMHLEDVCIEPDLLAKYNKLHADGRDSLPVLKGRQPFGRALGSEIKVAMRDSGHFLDPRSRNSWWIGR